ncbi:MAG: gliding motility-associated C-terminal domain-containing protein, partial [Chitinophagaceae bacterium]|nr:gliding motility-associated C-terminal domain-containing protein [Chitinophagaceae bacterium]
TIRDETPDIDISGLQLNATSCGLSNGSITGLQITGNSFATIQWKNDAGIVVGTSRDLQNVSAGRYKLVLLDATEACGDSTNFLVIPAIPAPAINSLNAVIQPATCDLANGGIRGIVLSGTIGPVFVSWVNELNNVVGSSIDLNNISPGRYRLKVKDASTCDTMFSNVFEIINNGAVTIDTTNAVVRSTGCTRINGGITGIRITGADQFQWINADNNLVVSTSIDLVNMPAGNYRLVATNSLYSCTRQSRVYSITTAQPIAVNITGVTAKDASCLINNGSINITQLSADRNLFSFLWLKDSTVPMGVSLELTGLEAGIYHLIATDTNGCAKAIYKRVIVMLAPPVIDESALRIANDTCEFETGAISGITVSGSPGPFTYRWLDVAGQIKGTRLNITGLVSGSYVLEVTDANNCIRNSSVLQIGKILTNLPVPKVVDLTIPRHSNAVIKVGNVLAGGLYELIDESSGVVIQNGTTGQFVIERVLTDMSLLIRVFAGPCRSTEARFSIKVIDFTKLEIPNAFSPNGDGINDRFRIKLTGYFRLDGLKIFNRWGQQVFETKDLTSEWDGTFKGKFLPPGIFYYLIEGLDVGGKKLRKSGSITLIR